MIYQYIVTIDSTSPKQTAISKAVARQLQFEFGQKVTVMAITSEGPMRVEYDSVVEDGNAPSNHKSAANGRIDNGEIDTDWTKHTHEYDGEWDGEWIPCKICTLPFMDSIHSRVVQG